MENKQKREIRCMVGGRFQPHIREASDEAPNERIIEGYAIVFGVEIYPQGRAGHGNDRKGDKSKVRYATIGFVAEYGTSSQQARPYMTTANAKAHEKVVEAQHSIWESETGK